MQPTHPLGSRRNFLALLAATALTGCRRAAPHPVQLTLAPGAGESSLRFHAASHHLLYGATVDPDLLHADIEFDRLVRQQCSIFAAPPDAVWCNDQTSADALVRFGERSHIKVRGPNLITPTAPEALRQTTTRDQARALLVQTITAAVSRYPGSMHSWPVAAHFLAPEQNRPDLLHPSLWLDKAGDDALELAFRTAREADPAALLSYTDSNLHAETPAAHDRRLALLQLLRRLKTRNVPLDAVALDARLHPGEPIGEGLRSLLTQLRALDLQVFLTNLEVTNPTNPSAAADHIAKLLGIALADTSVRAVLSASLQQANSLTSGAPFTQRARPTPAFNAIEAAFDSRGTVPGASRPLPRL